MKPLDQQLAALNGDLTNLNDDLRNAIDEAKATKPRPVTWAGFALWSPTITGALAWAWVGDWRVAITGLGMGTILGMVSTIVEKRRAS